MTTDEMAVYIGERLFKDFRVSDGDVLFKVIGDDEGPDYYEHFEHMEEFVEWLSSLQGIHAVKMAMIERGYEYAVCYV